MNARQRQVYEALLKTPPTSDQTGWGSAYFHGYRNPRMLVNNAGPIVGYQGSEARAAFKAGQTAARRAKAAGGASVSAKHTVGPLDSLSQLDRNILRAALTAFSKDPRRNLTARERAIELRAAIDGKPTGSTS